MIITKELDRFGGQYYMVHTDDPQERMVFPVETPEDIERFVASHRDCPFFVRGTAGGDISEMPSETQWFALKHSNGEYSVYFSMAFEVYRTAFKGKNGKIVVVAETGDEDTTTQDFCALYVIRGKNVYELVEKAAVSVVERFKTAKLRKDKPTPDFTDYFGWCTWDSFYHKVSGENVRLGLESFRKGGFVPKFLLLDDGWQTTTNTQPSVGEWQLTDFIANEKFNHRLCDTVAMAKNEFGVKKFFVWHALQGYWGGIDVNAPRMKKYNGSISRAVYPKEIREKVPDRWKSEFFDFGLVDPDKSFDFYNDYHSALRAEGVDGVKIDVQSSLEAHAQGRGGRISLNRRMREGLEESVCRNFDGALVNCMANANDVVYHSMKTNVMRSSGDFYPPDPASHSVHIFYNAVNSIFLGQFMGCDWDMFQTQHRYGPYHAASRAISGSPIYVSDRVDEHDYDVIRALTTAEGKILKPLDIAKPTLDCLFDNPIKDKTLYKLFNRNNCGYVVGVFSFEGENESADVCAADALGSTQGKYAAYSYKDGESFVCDWQEKRRVTLNPAEFDIITYAPIENGFAAVGLTGKYNCGGAVTGAVCGESGYTMTVRDGGELLFYCEKPVKCVKSGGACVEFAVNGGFVTAKIPAAGEVVVEL